MHRHRSRRSVAACAGAHTDDFVRPERNQPRAAAGDAHCEDCRAPKRRVLEEECSLSRTRPRGVTSVSTYSLSHLSDHVLLRDLTALVSEDRATTARLLAHLAEVDARRLYLPAGYPSSMPIASMSCVCLSRRPSTGSARRARHGSFPSSSRRWPKGGCI